MDRSKKSLINKNNDLVNLFDLDFPEVLDYEYDPCLDAPSDDETSYNLKILKEDTPQVYSSVPFSLDRDVPKTNRLEKQNRKTRKWNMYLRFKPAYRYEPLTSSDIIFFPSSKTLPLYRRHVLKKHCVLPNKMCFRSKKIKIRSRKMDSEKKSGDIDDVSVSVDVDGGIGEAPEVADNPAPEPVNNHSNVAPVDNPDGEPANIQQEGDDELMLEELYMNAASDNSLLSESSNSSIQDDPFALNSSSSDEPDEPLAKRLHLDEEAVQGIESSSGTDSVPGPSVRSPAVIDLTATEDSSDVSIVEEAGPSVLVENADPVEFSPVLPEERVYLSARFNICERHFTHGDCSDPQCDRCHRIPYDFPERLGELRNGEILTAYRFFRHLHFFADTIPYFIREITRNHSINALRSVVGNIVAFDGTQAGDVVSVMMDNGWSLEAAVDFVIKAGGNPTVTDTLIQFITELGLDKYWTILMKLIKMLTRKLSAQLINHMISIAVSRVPPNPALCKKINEEILSKGYANVEAIPQAILEKLREYL